MSAPHWGWALGVAVTGISCWGERSIHLLFIIARAAEGERDKGQGERERAKGERRKGEEPRRRTVFPFALPLVPFAYCLLPFAFRRRAGLCYDSCKEKQTMAQPKKAKDEDG